jgi:hypothetical protein
MDSVSVATAWMTMTSRTRTRAVLSWVLRNLLEGLRLASDRANRLLLLVSSMLISGELDDDEKGC